MPAAIAVKNTAERADPRLRPETPLPDVDPLPHRVPRPTSSPAATSAMVERGSADSNTVPRARDRARRPPAFDPAVRVRRGHFGYHPASKSAFHEVSV
jgi:hypothetical protein